MQIVLGLLFLLACFALLNDRPAWAGGLIGLAASVKPQFAPLGLQALWRKNWGFFAGLFSVALVLLALSVSLYGWRTHLEYLTVLEFLSKHGEYDHLNQSINGVLVRWLYEGPPLGRDPNGMIPQSVFPPFIGPVYVSTLLSSVVMLVIPFLVRSRASDPVSKLLEFCNASVLFTMASPIAWVHHYNILLPLYVIALKAALDRWEGTGRWIVLVLLAVSFLATGYPWAAASEATSASRNLLQSHVLIGAFLLIGIVFVELRKPVRKEQGTSCQDA
jgi:alpha-1,2-mannosyltransferase